MKKFENFYSGFETRDGCTLEYGNVETKIVYTILLSVALVVNMSNKHISINMPLMFLYRLAVAAGKLHRVYPTLSL